MYIRNNYYHIIMIIFTPEYFLNSRFRRLFLILQLEMVYIYFTEKKVIAQFRKREKMIGHHTRLRENDDLPLWRAPAIKKKPPFFNARALITREIMRRKDAQRNTKEWPAGKKNYGQFVS